MYHEIFKYLSNKTERYAEGCSDARKRAIRKFSDEVLLEDGDLFYVRSDSEEKPNGKGKRQWIADKDAATDSAIPARRSSWRMSFWQGQDERQSRYFWYGLFNDVDYYIRTCEKCQKVYY